MSGVVGVLIGVLLIAGLLLALAKMSDHGADANGCSGNCSSCGVPDSCRSCSGGGESADSRRS